MGKAFARKTDPSTSHAAAKKVAPNVQKLEKKVLDTLIQHWEGLTVPEISRLSGIDKWSVSPRMRPLEVKGMVSRDGKRCGATVWVAE